MRTTLILLLFCLPFDKLAAQENDYNVKNELAKIQQAYKGERPLSFSIQYLYSTVNAPQHYVDSIGGTFRLKGENSWGHLGDAEYICNKDYRITLYKATNTLLLDKRDDEEALAFFSMDSLFGKPEAFTVHTLQPGSVSLSIRGNQLCDSVFLRYDPATYYLQRIVYSLKSQPDADTKEQEKGLVQIVFSDYSTAAFDEAVLSADRYVQKKGKEYKPSNTYNTYNLYLASSKLLN
jgi:hypothetical protein